MNVISPKYILPSILYKSILTQGNGFASFSAVSNISSILIGLGILLLFKGTITTTENKLENEQYILTIESNTDGYGSDGNYIKVAENKCILLYRGMFNI